MGSVSLDMALNLSETNITIMKIKTNTKYARDIGGLHINTGLYIRPILDCNC